MTMKAEVACGNDARAQTWCAFGVISTLPIHYVAREFFKHKRKNDLLFLEGGRGTGAPRSKTAKNEPLNCPRWKNKPRRQGGDLFPIFGGVGDTV